MGAYIVELESRCAEPGCVSRPVVEVVNTFNSSCGKFGRKHGARKLAELQRGEARASAAARLVQSQISKKE